MISDYVDNLAEITTMKCFRYFFKIVSIEALMLEEKHKKIRKKTLRAILLGSRK